MKPTLAYLLFPSCYYHLFFSIYQTTVRGDRMTTQKDQRERETQTTDDTQKKKFRWGEYKGGGGCYSSCIEKRDTCVSCLSLSDAVVSWSFRSAYHYKYKQKEEKKKKSGDFLYTVVTGDFLFFFSSIHFVIIIKRILGTCKSITTGESWIGRWVSVFIWLWYVPDKWIRPEADVQPKTERWVRLLNYVDGALWRMW